jgi:very-short-patch-repair endonuclease
VRVALVLAGLAPVPQYEVRRGNDFLGRVDLALPELKIAIEYEGAYHFEETQIVRDDARYARLREAGWTVIRVSAADLRDLDGVVARVLAAVRAAQMAISAGN